MLVIVYGSGLQPLFFMSSILSGVRVKLKPVLFRHRAVHPEQLGVSQNSTPKSDKWEKNFLFGVRVVGK